MNASDELLVRLVRLADRDAAAEVDALLQANPSLARSSVHAAAFLLDAEACTLLREGLRWLPLEIEFYLQLGEILERIQPEAAIELYAAFPPPPPVSPHRSAHRPTGSCLRPRASHRLALFGCAS